jgi:flagellin-like hook-associated protein FlgL
MERASVSAGPKFQPSANAAPLSYKRYASAKYPQSTNRREYRRTTECQHWRHDCDDAALGLGGINVANDPNKVIGKVDEALTYLNEQRGGVGAAMNRLGQMINVNAINIETTSDTRSRILDAD